MSRDDRYRALLDDLADEEHALDAVVDRLDAEGAATATVAAGWDVEQTIAHLAGAEALAAVALTEPAAFGDPRRTATLTAAAGGSWPASLARWRAQRSRVLDALRRATPRERFPWVAGDLSAMSFATARLMETWAHGVDVADAVGVPYPATGRLRHVADLGVRTRPFAFAVHGLAAPDGEVRVELVAPDDDAVWAWGSSETEVVRGAALDFCLVVTQRRHVADSTLVVQGDHARAWMAIAQCFAGAPTTARRT